MKLPGLRYDSPYSFSLRQRLILLILPPLIALAIRLIFRCCRWEVRNLHHYEEGLELEGHAFLAIWHEIMGFAAYHFRGSNFHGLTSFSFDGELAARVVSWLGIEAVRGSSSKGGGEGLSQLQNALSLVRCVGFTLDGPRGPRRVAKPGVGIIAAREHVPVVPVAFAANRSWRLRSWDRLAIPKPFARVVCAFAEPIPPPASDHPEEVEKTRLAVESALNTLQAEIETELGDLSASH